LLQIFRHGLRGLTRVLIRVIREICVKKKRMGGRMAEKILSNKYRKAELAKIHIAKKELGKSEEEYRDMLWILCGVRSAADLNSAQRRDVLEHLKAEGFKAQKAKYPGRPKNMTPENSRTAQLEKIEALLTIGGKSWAYAHGIAKRICKVEKVEWVKANELYKIITALRKQAQREGWALEE